MALYAMRGKTAAVVVAGGKGLRYGVGIRKQYRLLRGRPLVWWSLSAFEKSPSVSRVVLVVPADDLSRIAKMNRKWRFSKLADIVPGGHTRKDSVQRGLQALSHEIEWVVVHDAVRPLISKDTIEKTIQSARQTGAALAATPSRDTVKISSKTGFVEKTPPRETVWLAQTPQVIRRDLLEKAYRRAAKFQATDDVQLVERIGVKVRLVESPAENIKITVPSDLEIAENILRNRT